jgi:hypothetical protein
MISDLNDSSCPNKVKTDICIVGAGPAGISIALQFIGSGFTVCLAESGGWVEDSRTQRLYDGDSFGHPMALTEGRCRVFGGSATRWGGASATLDAIDFEQRSWVQNSGWPISFDSLEKYYEKAKLVGNFKEPWVSDSDAMASINRQMPFFRSGNIDPFIWRVSAPDLHRSLNTYLSLGRARCFDWARSYAGRLKKDPKTNVILHSNLVGLSGENRGRHVKTAQFKSLNGHSVEVNAKAFVICCSGIENARILLNLPSDISSSMDGWDNVGRYFAQHPRGVILTLQPTNESAIRLQRQFHAFLRPRYFPIYYELGFALSERAQREFHLLNAGACMNYSSSAWAAAKRLRESLKSRSAYPSMISDLKTIMSDAGSFVENIIGRFILGHEVILANPNVRVVVDLEQEPNYSSKITLSDKVDELGVRRAVIDWKISEIERRTAREFAKFITVELEELGFGRAELEPWLTSNAPVRQQDLFGTYHFIGATRMASSSRDGVTDENCRVFGLDNLYIAGSSVFPTGGHANPTLTIVALAIRLADHLLDQFLNM